MAIFIFLKIYWCYLSGLLCALRSVGSAGRLDGGRLSQSDSVLFCERSVRSLGAWSGRADLSSQSLKFLLRGESSPSPPTCSLALLLGLGSALLFASQSLNLPVSRWLLSSASDDPFGTRGDGCWLEDWDRSQSDMVYNKKNENWKMVMQKQNRTTNVVCKIMHILVFVHEK